MPKTLRRLMRFWWLLAAFLLAFIVSVGRAAAQADAGSCVRLPDSVPVDQVWAAVPVGYAAVSSKKFVYLGYFDAERWLTVAALDRCTGSIKRVRLNSRFGGWDGHNLISMEIDSDGLLHVAGNMHANPLVYAAMSQPDMLESLRLVNRMTGQSEGRVTYPKFIKFPDGSLGFSYRDGVSGEGAVLLNRYLAGRWQRWVDTPLFGAGSARSPASAYPTEFIQGDDGFFHVAWVWRLKGGVENNFGVHYAKSPDLKSWVNAEGTPLRLPLNPGDATLADDVPVRSGLFNNIRLGFDLDGRPVISYLRFDSAGNSQLYHARHGREGWNSEVGSAWVYRWDPRGGGSIAGQISFTGVKKLGGRLLERVNHPVLGRNVTLEFDVSNLKNLGVRRDVKWPEFIPIGRSSPQGMLLRTLLIASIDRGDHYDYVASWPVLPADNRDLPKACEGTLMECRFVSELWLHIPQ